MNTRGWHVIIAGLCCLMATLVAEVSRADEGYRLNPGDRLKITVWQEDNLQGEVVVLPDGTLSFPLIGHLPAAGKTTAELTGLLTRKLAEFIPNPEVNVTLLKAAGNLVYIIGQVNKPGPYGMSGPTDVMQALSMAGGLTPFAGKNEIHILRRDAEGHAQTFDFIYSDVESGEDLQSNILLRSGDTVIVP